MTKREPIVNIRMQAARIAELDLVAKKDDLNRSAWAREVILLALDSGLTLEQLTILVRGPETPPVNGERKLGATMILTGKCLHPVHLREQFPTFDRCLCGVKFPR